MIGARGLEKAVIEKQAEEILKDLGLFRLPVDPFEIIRKERIKLAPGGYDDCFDARLEYHSSKQRFFLFYADERTGRTEGRIRFTLGHELGHFYLAEHRRFLTNRYWHSSHTGFVSDSRLEREADSFAAALLMPARLFRQMVGDFRQSCCTLSELTTLANRLHVSVTAAAIRYCDLDIEASSVILSRNGETLFHVPSYAMKRRKYTYVPKGEAVPATSKAHQLLDDRSEDRVEGPIDAGVWYEDRSGELWEESIRLGNTGLMLTYLTLPLGEDTDEDDEEEDDH